MIASYSNTLSNCHDVCHISFLIMHCSQWWSEVILIILYHQFQDGYKGLNRRSDTWRNWRTLRIQQGMTSIDCWDVFEQSWIWTHSNGLIWVFWCISNGWSGMFKIVNTIRILDSSSWVIDMVMLLIVHNHNLVSGLVVNLRLFVWENEWRIDPNKENELVRICYN